jgi:hypothetical protein
LEWLQLDADGEKKPADALVFSDEVGEPVDRFRTAWVTAVLKANDMAKSIDCAALPTASAPARPASAPTSVMIAT